MHINKQTVDTWICLMDSYITSNAGVLDRFAITQRSHVVRGVDAWALAGRAGILQLAYADPKIIDAHIQTALERIFPNATFLDKKRY